MIIVISKGDWGEKREREIKKEKEVKREKIKRGKREKKD